MADPVEKPIDMKKIAIVARDLTASAGIGWAAAMGAAHFMQERLSDNSEQFNDFLSFLKSMVWITVAGIVYAVILHIHSKRSRDATHADDRALGRRDE